MVEMTRKRIATIVGLCFSLLGFILVVAGASSISAQWDDENCCANKDCTVGGVCETLCNLQETVFFTGEKDSWFEPDSGKPDCCYGVDGESYPSAGINMGMGGGAFAIVVITAIILEFGDKVCCECCQKCTACIIAAMNILALVFVILVIVFSLAPADADGDGCESYTIAGIFGQSGTYVAGFIFMALGVMAAIVVTFIECCCDDSGKDNDGGATASA